MVGIVYLKSVIGGREGAGHVKLSSVEDTHKTCPYNDFMRAFYRLKVISYQLKLCICRFL